VRDVEEWLAQDQDKNVIAVHCKGGKGRTGTMICAWLMYSKSETFKDSKDVLDFFGNQRTDKSIGTKYQGVETPSQGRYIDYFNQVLTEFGGRIPTPKRLALKEIRIQALAGVGSGDGSDLTCTVTCAPDVTSFIMDFGTQTQTNCEAQYLPEQDFLRVKPLNCPILSGDVRLKFNCKTRSVPRAYEDCAFYFWFNTSFVDTSSDSQDRSSLTIPRNLLDNPHKVKTHNLYREKFCVQLFFNTAS
jgi:PTEN phosphatase family protein